MGTANGKPDSLKKYLNKPALSKAALASLLIFVILMLPVNRLNLGNFTTDKTTGTIHKDYVNVSIVFLILVFLLSAAYIRQSYRYWNELGVLSSSPTPLVGHTFRRLGITMPVFQFYDEMYHNFNGRDFCGFYDFLKPGLIVGNLQLLKNILIEDFEHFANRRTFQLEKVNPIANDMLTNATGGNWKRIRGVVSPTFTSLKLRQLYPLICQRGDAFVQLFKQRRETEAQNECGLFTMDTIASCAFGIECEAMNSDAADFTKTAAKVFQFTPVRALKIITLLTVPSLANAVQYLGVDFTSPEFHFFHAVVSKTLRMREEMGIRRGDFLDLMKDTKNLSETTMTAQAILFILAGYDNIANTLSFALHLLAMHPGIQKELREELHNAKREMGSEEVSFETLQKLPYLNAIVNETLRLYPGTPVAERLCTRDYIIPGTKVPVKKGQHVIIPIWSIHRDPGHWTDPEEFQPERFLHIRFAHKDLIAFLPFGTGPRQCVGLKFALLVIKVGLMKLLDKHQILPSENTVHPPPLHPRSVLSLKSTNGLPLIIAPTHGGGLE